MVPFSLLLFWPSLSLGCHNSVLNRSLMYFVKFSDALHEKCRNLRTTDYADSADGFIQKDGAHETHERNEIGACCSSFGVVSRV